MKRRTVLTGLGVLAAAGAGAYWTLAPKPAEVGFILTETELARAHDFLAAHVSIDVHAHPGRTFVRGASGLNWKLKLYQMLGSFEPRIVGEMKAGGLTAASFSAVSDFPVLDLQGGGLSSVREFKPGEAYGYYQAQIANLKALAADGLVHPVLTPDDVAAAKALGKPGAIFAVEGADFIEDDLSRVAKAFDDGVRMITLVHYISGGAIGDIMTAPPVHDGLTELGAGLVEAIGESRIMLDLSHASEKTAFDALSVTKKPVVATHTHINSLGIGHPRFISPELAKAIADTGGYIGAWPAGIGITSLDGFATRVVDLVKAVGEDHVALGSDMDANYKPVLETYLKLPLLVGVLLKRGMPESVLAKMIGGNAQRVFADTLA
ncbi:MAG: membrane dipeptidase [Rhizobiaceae bacterium]